MASDVALIEGLPPSFNSYLLVSQTHRTNLADSEEVATSQAAVWKRDERCFCLEDFERTEIFRLKPGRPSSLERTRLQFIFVECFLSLNFTAFPAYVPHAQTQSTALEI